MKQAGKILVTGGAGFIGSHLVERLLRDGYSVVVIDDCSTGSLTNLAAVKDHPALQLIQARVSDCPDLPIIIGQCDFAFHLAAAVGVELVVHSPIFTIQNNIDETEVLLLSAAAADRPVLIASTSEVYGKSTKESFSETDDLLIGPPTLGRWSYACSKLLDEFLAMAYFHQRKLPVTIARLFNTVGPRQSGRYGMVLPRFIASALKNEPLKVFGTGEQTRCFCFVEDTVEALIRLAKTDQARGEIYNVGRSEEISILDLARKVISQLNSRSEVEFVPYDQAYAAGFEDMLRRKPLVEKLERHTGFRASVGLEEIIARIASSSPESQP